MGQLIKIITIISDRWCYADGLRLKQCCNHQQNQKTLISGTRKVHQKLDIPHAVVIKKNVIFFIPIKKFVISNCYHVVCRRDRIFLYCFKYEWCLLIQVFMRRWILFLCKWDSQYAELQNMSFGATEFYSGKISSLSKK